VAVSGRSGGYRGAVATAQPDPPLAADELVAAGPEREVLEAFLDFHREVLVRKVSGISEQQARLRRVPSKTTLAGLVKHMTGVERGWFQRVLAGRPADEIGLNAGGGDDSWDLADGETVAPPAWTADAARTRRVNRHD
jgi:Protein of unknown function (DUF664)